MRKISKSKIWFTSDTHFGSERVLIGSSRPYPIVEIMDIEIRRNWNSVVSNQDIVYHLGDFGNPEMIKVLRGKKIFFLQGNHDTNSIVAHLLRDSRVKLIGNNYSVKLDNHTQVKLVHKPNDANDNKAFYLFGHIHNLQTIKKRGLNVGIDCHDFEPIDVNEILFYIRERIPAADSNVYNSKLDN